MLNYEVKLDCIFGQNRGLDKSTGGAHLDDDGSNYWGPRSAIMWWPRLLCSASWTHSPPFQWTSCTRAPHPPSQGSCLKLMLSSPGWGSTAWILHIPCLPTAAARLKTCLKEAILCSTGGNAATTVSTRSIRLPLPQHLKQTGRDADELPQEGVPSTSSPAVCSPAKPKHTRSPSPHGLLVVQLFLFWQGLSIRLWIQEEVIRAHRAHQVPVPDQAAAVGPMMGPQQNLKPAYMQGICPLMSSIRWKCRSPLCRWGQWRRGGCLGLCQWGRHITREYVSAWHLHYRWWGHSQMQGTWTCLQKWHWLRAAWKDKLICDGVMDIQEWDSMVNDYADAGNRRPKNPDTIGSPISYMKERAGCFSAYHLRQIPWGYVTFTLHGPIQSVYASASETTQY